MDDDGIVNVWQNNLETEIANIRNLLTEFPFVSMDTEFPGVVARPIGNFKSSTDYHYQTLRVNVDLLKLIQLGITLSDANGNLPPPGNTHTWQFNFKFSLTDDMYAQDSIDLLTKAGIDFKKHETQGIAVNDFGELMTSSGMVLLPDVKWVSFHSGYDFGYLLKVLTAAPLPVEESEFFELLHLYFPFIYDVKYLIKNLSSGGGKGAPLIGLKAGGLQDIADELGIQRIGPQHQAGSDALLTSRTFFKIKSINFKVPVDEDRILGQLYGLGASLSGSSTAGNVFESPQNPATEEILI